MPLRRFFTEVSIAALAASHVSAADCDLRRLTPLLADPDLTACATATGLTLPPPTAPAPEQLRAICGVADCVRLIATLSALNLGDCTLGSIRMDSELLMPAREVCANTPTAAPPVPAHTYGSSQWSNRTASQPPHFRSTSGGGAVSNPATAPRTSTATTQRTDMALAVAVTLIVSTAYR